MGQVGQRWAITQKGKSALPENRHIQVMGVVSHGRIAQAGLGSFCYQVTINTYLLELTP